MSAMLRPGFVSALAFAIVCPLQAQHKVPAQSMHHRVICAVTLVGAGTQEDPRRPLFAPKAEEAGKAKELPAANSRAGIARPGIIGYSTQLSDDGNSAIVEFIAADRAAFSTVLRDGRARCFERGKQSKAQVEAEFRSRKKDFDLSKFQGAVIP